MSSSQSAAWTSKYFEVLFTELEVTNSTFVPHINMYVLSSQLSTCQSPTNWHAAMAFLMDTVKPLRSKFSFPCFDFVTQFQHIKAKLNFPQHFFFPTGGGKLEIRTLLTSFLVIPCQERVKLKIAARGLKATFIQTNSLLSHTSYYRLLFH